MLCDREHLEKRQRADGEDKSHGVTEVLNRVRDGSAAEHGPVTLSLTDVSKAILLDRALRAQWLTCCVQMEENFVLWGNISEILPRTWIINFNYEVLAFVLIVTGGLG